MRYNSFLAWMLGFEPETQENFKPDVVSETMHNSYMTKKEFENSQKNFFEAEQKLKETEKIVLKEASLDVNRINEYQGVTLKQFEFRPKTWEQFIGQTEAKERAKTIFKKVAQGIRSHCLIDGIKGHGKTTYVEILAKSLNAKLIKRIGKQVDEESIVDLLNEINSSIEKNVVLFIDEFDTMNWKVIKVLNTVLESFELAGKKIKPFIFAGATINKHILLKNNPDTLDRISVHIKFSRYTLDEIISILKQYKEQLYPNSNITSYDYLQIAMNCKFNPRTSISLLEELIVEEDIETVLKNCKILKDGLTDIDIKILSILKEAKRPMGSNALAMRVGIGELEYLREFEPYLCEYGYVARVPSRIITDKGKQLLGEIYETRITK